MTKCGIKRERRGMRPSKEEGETDAKRLIISLCVTDDVLLVTAENVLVDLEEWFGARGVSAHKNISLEPVRD